MDPPELLDSRSIFEGRVVRLRSVKGARTSAIIDRIRRGP